MQKSIREKSCSATLFLEKTYMILDVKCPWPRTPNIKISYHGTRTAPSSGSPTWIPSRPLSSPGTSNTKRSKALCARHLLLNSAQHLRVQKSQKIDFTELFQTSSFPEGRPFLDEDDQKESQIKKRLVNSVLLRSWRGESWNKKQGQEWEVSGTTAYQCGVLNWSSEGWRGEGVGVLPFRRGQHGLLPAPIISEPASSVWVGQHSLLLRARVMLYFNTDPALCVCIRLHWWSVFGRCQMIIWY